LEPTESKEEKTMTIKLQSCDVLLYVDEGTGWTSVVSRWAIGRYHHAAMYLEKFCSIPLLYQSTGRGVGLDSLSLDTGKLVMVMRPEYVYPEHQIKIATIAIAIASDPQSYYDYLAIVSSCLPRVLEEKFPWLPLPLKYQRDKYMICSEAVAEAFWRADIEVLPKDVIPLPGDFLTSPVLKIMGEGRVMDDVIP
jgi:hypothetical protein